MTRTVSVSNNGAALRIDLMKGGNIDVYKEYLKAEGYILKSSRYIDEGDDEPDNFEVIDTVYSGVWIGGTDYAFMINDEKGVKAE